MQNLEHNYLQISICASAVLKDIIPECLCPNKLLMGRPKSYNTPTLCIIILKDSSNVQSNDIKDNDHLDDSWPCDQTAGRVVQQYRIKTPQIEPETHETGLMLCIDETTKEFKRRRESSYATTLRYDHSLVVKTYTPTHTAYQE